jgi:hypothetical protein
MSSVGISLIGARPPFRSVQRGCHQRQVVEAPCAPTGLVHSPGGGAASICGCVQTRSRAGTAGARERSRAMARAEMAMQAAQRPTPQEPLVEIAQQHRKVARALLEEVKSCCTGSGVRRGASLWVATTRRRCPAQSTSAAMAPLRGWPAPRRVGDAPLVHPAAGVSSLLPKCRPSWRCNVVPGIAWQCNCLPSHSACRRHRRAPRPCRAKTSACRSRAAPRGCAADRRACRRRRSRGVAVVGGDAQAPQSERHPLPFDGAAASRWPGRRGSRTRSPRRRRASRSPAPDPAALRRTVESTVAASAPGSMPRNVPATKPRKGCASRP